MVQEKLKAIEKYASDAFSLSEAASFAGVSAGEMMESPAQKGIKANYTLERSRGII
jgi:predicted HTH domain antitoxin